jgi:mRNA-degrading endonuclease RelE of RelBE toxin-antitoxin system
MPDSFRLIVSPQFKADVRKLVRRSIRLLEPLDEIFVILGKDPYNISGQYNIKKLDGLTAGQGQWRIRFGDYRIRYDIFGIDVILHSYRRPPRR